MKECIKRLWNTLKTTVLNVKLQRLYKSHHLQCITSSNDSEKLERNLCVRDKVEDLCWMPVVFGPSETTVSKHNPPCHLQMPTKALSCKKEAICEHGPEAPSCPVDQGSFKIFQSRKVFYGQTSPNLTLLLEITDAVSFRQRRRETFQRVISFQLKSQNL